ncbi:serine/threonine protein kinase [Sphingomonas sp. Sphisp140]|uniref:serine/threonine protein kinase n=1 Tax=unclassified Sphingomonas TaxID=196159 RepID=UPI0039AED715
MPERDDRVPLPVGARASRFEILGEPRYGSFGLTYPAKDVDGKRVALKEYFPRAKAHRLANGDVLIESAQFDLDGRSFLKEVGALGLAPPHDAIAALIAADVDHGTGYIAQQWIDGEPLSRVSCPDDRTVTSWFLQLLDAVLTLSAANLVHHDIKPENIMVRPDGSVALVDLGAAHFLTETGYFDLRWSGASPAFSPPEFFESGYEAGLWTDIFGLCASFYALVGNRPPVRFDLRGRFDGLEPRLVDRMLRQDPGLPALSLTLLDAIDLGLSADPLLRPRSAGPFLERLRRKPEDLAELLPPGFGFGHLADSFERPASLASTPFRAKREEKPGTMPERFQTAIIQSLDSARFQKSAFRTSGGLELDNSQDQKIALARTEVFLNLMFGREIVLPAGHLADSFAVVSIVGEILDIYQREFQQRIDLACARNGLPAWRPFRLAIEDRGNQDGYRGFVARYRYTGATLPVLMAAGRREEMDSEEGKRAQLEFVRHAFLERRFDDLERKVQPGYGAYAARCDSYFRDDTSVFPIDDRPFESLAGYAGVFRRRIGHEGVAGAGVGCARDSLSVVDEIEAKLKKLQEIGEDGATGFRGNWYLFSDQFKDVWPLARGYLDAKLFVEMAAKYGIDHPVLVSQAYEYGQFDHSLVLGPGFGAGVTGDPELEHGLTELTAALSADMPWRSLLELFTEDAFLESIKRLNLGYRQGGGLAYRQAVAAHGEMVADKIKPIQLEVRTGRLTISAGTDGDASLTIDSYDAMLQVADNEEKMRQSAESVFSGLGSSNFDAAGINLLPLRSTLRSSDGAPSSIVHYFVKPVRLRYALPGST